MFLAPLNYDRFFKKIFSDKRIAQRFLEDFLEIEIEDFEMLKEKHYVTDDASCVEFDFRCKIKGAYVIIDMQQWYKRDIGQRFYLSHALNTGLQLENLPMQLMVFNRKTKLMQKAKDYRALEPVFTLIWMATDALGFSQNYVSYVMTPEMVLDFLNNDRLWNNPVIVDLLKERERVLEVVQNETKDLDFLPKNRLIFLLQKNIVKNKALRKYEKWFEFAEKTRNKKNTEEDFREYMGDEIFCEMMRRLRRDGLTTEDYSYIAEEEEFWIEVERMETGLYEDGKKDGEKIGEKKGERIANEKVVLNMFQKGIPPEDISSMTGIALPLINEIIKTVKVVEQGTGEEG
jgi:hypothetical protein